MFQRNIIDTFIVDSYFKQGALYKIQNAIFEIHVL